MTNRRSSVRGAVGMETQAARVIELLREGSGAAGCIVGTAGRFVKRRSLLRVELGARGVEHHLFLRGNPPGEVALDQGEPALLHVQPLRQHRRA